MNPLSHPERKGIALYIQLASVLRGRIAQGQWQPGQQLPSIPELGAEYEVGIVTVRQALAELAREGLVSSARGRGTFVTALPASPAASPQLREAINDPLGLAPGQAITLLTDEDAGELPASLQTGQPQCAAYRRVRTLHTLQAEPFGVMDSYVERDTYDRFAPGDVQRHKVGYLVRAHNRLPLERVRQEITIGCADWEVAALLGCAATDAVARVRRWWTDAGHCIRYAGLYFYRADRFVLDFEHRLDEGAAGMDQIPRRRAARA
ncbi:MAG: GntR family transcriptional regulator [Delftia acidovorans]|nr:GntR family transcriptional regulator [Delftia acidovorans]